MKKVIAGIRDAVSTFLYGRSTVSCETCGETVRPSRAVWRGARPYCSAAHEHADFDISLPIRVIREGAPESARSRLDHPVGAPDPRLRKPVRRRDSRTRPVNRPFHAGGY